MKYSVIFSCCPEDIATAHAFVSNAMRIAYFAHLRRRKTPTIKPVWYCREWFRIPSTVIDKLE